MKTKLTIIVAVSAVALTLPFMFVSSHIRGDDAPKSGTITGSKDKPAQSDPKASACTLEGTLKIHPKFLYKYYLADFGGGQTCALFGLDKFNNVRPGSGIQVTGQLGTRFHSGGTKDNLSPFPTTWIIYMNVETMKVTREPEPQLSGPKPKGQAAK